MSNGERLARNKIAHILREAEEHSVTSCAVLTDTHHLLAILAGDRRQLSEFIAAAQFWEVIEGWCNDQFIPLFYSGKYRPLPLTGAYGLGLAIDFHERGLIKLVEPIDELRAKKAEYEAGPKPRVKRKPRTT